MHTLFILSLYGASGVYSSAPLTASQTWDILRILNESGAVYSISKIYQ